MKQQIAVLIGTLLIIPGCAKSDGDMRSDSGTETTATGAPASAERNSASDNVGSGSTYDTSAAATNSVSDAAVGAGSAVPPASAQGSTEAEPASTNKTEAATPPGHRT